MGDSPALQNSSEADLSNNAPDVNSEKVSEEDVNVFMDVRSTSQIPLTDNSSENKSPVDCSPVNWTSHLREDTKSSWWSFCIVSPGKLQELWLTNISVSVLCLVLAVGVSVGLGYYAVFVREPKPQIDQTVEAFHIPNHMASKHYDALQQAIHDLRSYYNSRKKRHSDSKKRHARRFRSGRIWPWKYLDNSKISGGGKQRETRDTVEDKYQIFIAKKLELIYVARDSKNPNIFTEESLLDVNRVEKMIMQKKGFVNYCYKNYPSWSLNRNLDKYDGCAPLNSLLTYFFPSYSVNGNERLAHYDSLGSLTSNISTMLDFAMTNKNFYWYTDDKISSENKASKILRSEVHFGLPLKGFAKGSDLDIQRNLVQDFLLSYMNELSEASTRNVDVLYGGTDVFDHLVKDAFWSDIKLSVFTVTFILICMFVLTSFSLWLTFWGMTSILVSFPLAFFAYRVLGQTDHLGILNGAAAFVIIGIGVDDVFVFVNTFRLSRGLACLQARMRHTMWTASKATFFTSFTTAAAFTANIASSIPAVHDFGLFMSLIVICCWLMVCCIMPPAIILWAQYIAPWEVSCYDKCHCRPGDSEVSPWLQVPVEYQLFGCIAEDSLVTKDSCQTSGSSSSNQLVQFDNPAIQDQESTSTEVTKRREVTESEEVTEGDDGGITLQFPSSASSTVSTATEASVDSSKDGVSRSGEAYNLTSLLQAVVYRCIAQPVVKYRWFMFGGYLAVLVASVGLITQLEFASKPPQLFDSHSNLQKLIDLTANFSHQSITCDHCSAFFATGGPSYVGDIPQGVLPNTPRGKPPQPNQPESNPHISRPSSSTAAVTPPNRLSSSSASTTRSSASRTTSSSLSRRTSAATTQRLPDISQFRSVGDDTRDRPSTPPPTPTTPRLPEVDPCREDECHATSRTSLEVGASIFIVFGIKGIDRSNVSRGQVLTEKGHTIYDTEFEANFSLRTNGHFNLKALKELCLVCKLIANKTDMVVEGSGQCVPSLGSSKDGSLALLRTYLDVIPECNDLPTNRRINGKWMPSRAMAGITKESLKWIAFAFHSTTYKGQSYFRAYDDYQKWNSFIEHIRRNILSPDSPLTHMYQTSEFWPQVMMEVVAVSSAIYGLVFSLVICIAAVAVFTGHASLLLIITATILGVISLVLAIFYLIGWEVGAVEAVSLSILVGSSVDYCAHLVEGFLLAGRYTPPHAKSESEVRQWRSLASMTHIGISIISSALTTVIASIPLTQTTIVPFSKFGQIVAINTTVSIVYSLTACTAFLSLFAPAHFINSWRSTLIAFVATCVVVATGFVAAFVVSKCGYHIPGPNGEDIFSVPT